MKSNLIPWLLSQIKDGYTTKQIVNNYAADPFEGEIGDKSLMNRTGEVRAVLTAIEDMLCDDPTRATRLIEQVSRDNELAVTLKTYDIRGEEDLRRWLGYEDNSVWKCKSFKARASQNAANPWWIVEGLFEERERYPVIESVRVDVPKPPSVTTGLTDAVFSISDGHIPFQDERCFSLAVRIVADLRPRYIMLNGDMLDATDISKWPADIEHRNRIQESLIRLAQFIAQLREASPGSTIVYLEGNHEDRLRRVILENVAGAVGLKRVDDLDGYDALSIPNLLGLKELGVEWVPYKTKGYWITDSLKFHHGEELNVTKMAKERDYSMVLGHGHRVEIVSTANEKRNGQDDSYACMFGCTCRLDGAVPSVKSTMNWQQSLGVVYYDERNSSPVPVYIHDGEAFFQGQKYTANN